ncbi:YybH family protein [Pseudonocardia sp. CA-107938]|uniref:YybH family protein n=1 Tax=Pseudonocardia sp. CA-107938 TaxID=3240021 RepID=UPI003D8F4351
MTTDEQQICTLIERWAAAVHDGDLETTLAAHAEDIVMFDVPEPEDGVRGLAAYREAWPGFFEWQASGAVFEIVELHVEAGGDVAFAWALLRCGMPDEVGIRRLRLTLGLRRTDSGWVVAHEHHSFTDGDDARSTEQVRAVHEDWYAATVAKDLDGIVAHLADDVVSYEHGSEVNGVEEVRAECAKGLDQGLDVAWTVPDLQIQVRDDLAVGWGHNRMEHDGQVSWSRGTRVFRKRAGGWEMVHQHVSFPVEAP